LLVANLEAVQRYQKKIKMKKTIEAFVQEKANVASQLHKNKHELGVALSEADVAFFIENAPEINNIASKLAKEENVKLDKAKSSMNAIIEGDCLGLTEQFKIMQQGPLDLATAIKLQTQV